MRLGLINGPFVPHNLMSVQKNPVPLAKLQMAPRLEILMSSGSKKGTHIGVIQEESAILCEMIVCVILSKKVHMNVGPILDGYGVMDIYINSRTRPRVNRVLRNQLAGDVLNLVAYRLRCKHYVCHVTRAVHNRAAASFAAGGGIFENQLYAQINSN